MRRTALLVGLAMAFAAADARGAAPAVSVGSDGVIHADGVQIPPSRFLSPEAHAQHLQTLRAPPEPAKGGDWIVNARAVQDRIQSAVADAWRARYAVKIESTLIGGVPVDVVTPSAGVSKRNKQRVLINLHGGGFFVGAQFGGLAETIPVAGRGAIRVVTVNYRLGPENKFPAASEDVARVYRDLLKQYKPSQIGLYGCSAGGALVAQSVSWFQQQGLPAPGAIGIFCSGALAPFFYGGDSAAYTPILNGQLQPSLQQMTSGMQNPYYGAHDTKDPLLSPAASREVLARFPPTLFVTGTRDTALSNALATNARMLEAGVETQLFVQEGMGHQDFNNLVNTPEAAQAHDVIWHFFDKRLAR